MDGGRQGVGAERGLQVRVIGEILGLIERVRHTPLRLTVGEVVLLARGGIGAERTDEVGIGSDILQAIDRARLASAQQHHQHKHCH